MTSGYNRHEKVWSFNCDGAGCHKNHEGEPGNDARIGWVAAKDAGWVNYCTYWKGISTWKHYCPDCKAALGD